MTHPSLWQAAQDEMAEYHFHAPLELQPKWDIPDTIALNVAVAGRVDDSGSPYPTSLEEYLDAAREVISAGAAGIHLDFTFVTDKQGRRLDKDMAPADGYRTILEPLREEFGWSFMSNLNVLNGPTFEECLRPATEGLAEVAPSAAGHPPAFMVPALQRLKELGIKPQIAIHSSGEIELAKRKLVDAGIVELPAYWILLYGMPFNCGRTLLSGTWVSNPLDMAQHMFLMVQQIRQIDPHGVIEVCAAGRATLYMTTLATMFGLNIRVGTEDTKWKYPNSDETFANNLEMVEMAKEIAKLHGRRLATADEFRAQLGMATKG